MSSSEEDHPTVRPVSSLPAASVACAVSSTVLPEFSVVLLGLIERLEIAAGETVMAEVSAASLVEAMTIAEPVLTPVIMPAGDTVT